MVHRLSVVMLLVALGCGRSLPPKPTESKPAVAQPAAGKPIQQSIRILKDDGGDLDLVWTGDDLDDQTILAAVKPLYEMIRTRVNQRLQGLPEQATDKIFIRLWTARTSLFPCNRSVAYLAIDSTELAHVIPEWDRATIRFTKRRDKATRPSERDETLFLELTDLLFKSDDRAATRKAFCEKKRMTPDQLKRLEAHCILWDLGGPVTQQAIDDFVKD